MSHDNTCPTSPPKDIQVALLGHAAHLSRIWLGSSAPRRHRETAAVLAERLMILLAESVEQWWYSQYRTATSCPELHGRGQQAILVAALSSDRRRVTLDLGGLVRDLAASAGQQFEEALNALVKIGDCLPWAEVVTLATSLAVRIVARWEGVWEDWLIDEQVIHLPLPPQRVMH